MNTALQIIYRSAIPFKKKSPTDKSHLFVFLTECENKNPNVIRSVSTCINFYLTIFGWRSMRRVNFIHEMTHD